MSYESLPYDDKRKVRIGYLKTHKHAMQEGQFKELTKSECERYYAVGAAEQRRQRNNAITGYVIVAIIVIAGFAYFKFHKNNAQSPATSNSYSSSGSSTSTSGAGGSSTSTSSTNNGLDANGCYTPATVRSHENTNGCVDFNVGYTYTDSAGTVFIDQLTNYTDGVEVYIPYNSAAASINLAQLQGKNIKATGPISNYDGAPQVTVTELSQIGIYP